MKSSKFPLWCSLHSAFRPAIAPVLGAVVILAGCSQTPPPAPAPAAVSKTTVAAPEKPEAEAEVFKLDPNAGEVSYQRVEQPVTAIATDAFEQQQRDLLQEAKTLLEEKLKPERSLAITHNLRLSTYGQIRQQNMLPLLQSYLVNQQFAAAELLLEQNALTEVAPADRTEFTLLAANFLSDNKQLLSALRWLFAQDELAGNAGADAELQNLLWQNLVQLSPQQRSLLVKNARPRAAAWLNLVEIAVTFAGQQQAMQQALDDWQQRHPGMPELSALPKAITELASTPAYQPARVGVILPLSGNMKALGEAVQLGMVAASTQAPERSLHFIDSNQSAEQILAALETTQVDFVVGPLLREDVDKLQTLPNWRWPTLFLNSKQDNNQPNPDQFYFALSAEDEAAQMVELFQQRHYQHPVLISARSPINQRMAQHFQQLWQEKNGDKVESYSFNTQDELRSLITTFLETAASTERVNEISKYAGSTVNAEMHSRQDVDAIYLLADPTQTRLFKPFIDVSVSPTAPALPIYASSRSHSLAIDRTDIRDLAGMTLTEIPWLVPQQPQLPLRAEYEQLFAEQDETSQRLFAMGYDAMALIGRLKQQQQFPAMLHHGLTGSLRLGKDQNIQRQLTVARYGKGKLTALDATKNN
ncbi:penicillin-binding protein activator [Rheinheimera sp.]|uniref:penicillin-binding protein activator n=1 Tax=Rheinheimera sp. TaxID=1869214 RepID=UPI0025DD079B|nr:penicillin-binding protein activator [Rheinheimera sp.]